MGDSQLLNAGRAVLVVVDVQEAFRKAIPDFAVVVSKIAMAIRGFRILEVPILVTEQYPQGLGKTIEELSLTLPDDLVAIDKTTFHSWREPTPLTY